MTVGFVFCRGVKFGRKIYGVKGIEAFERNHMLWKYNRRGEYCGGPSKVRRT